MNTHLPARPSLGQPPAPVTAPAQVARAVQRVGLLDRLALHLGVALVAWSRRPRVPGPTRAELTLRHAERVALERRQADDELRRLRAGVYWRA